jgi:hypothetical protein
MTTSFSGRRSRSTRKEPPTIGKQLVNFITWGCESSAPFCNLYIIWSFVNKCGLQIIFFQETIVPFFNQQNNKLLSKIIIKTLIRIWNNTTTLKARCHYQSFPSKTLSKKIWTKKTWTVFFIIFVKELEENLVSTKKWLQLSQIMKTLLSLYV